MGPIVLLCLIGFFPCNALAIRICPVKINPTRWTRGLVATLPLPGGKKIAPGDEALRIFSSRLGLGQLQHLGEGRFAYWAPKVTPCSEGAPSMFRSRRQGSYDSYRKKNATYPPQIAEFLSACPVYFISDQRGRLIPSSYPAADPASLPALVEDTPKNALSSASAATPTSSTPASAAYSLGLFFLSPRDAEDYLECFNTNEDAGSSYLTIRAVPLSRAYQSLRYLHPDTRHEAAMTHSAPFALYWLWSTARKLLSREEGSNLRCILVPSTETLTEELRRQKNSILGTPIYSLPTIEVKPGSYLHKMLQRQYEQQDHHQLEKKTDSVYQLFPIEITANRWVLAVRFNGRPRIAFFCNSSDAHKAYQSFRSQLPSRSSLPSTAALMVCSLENILSLLSSNKNTSKLSPLLLPSLESPAGRNVIN